MIINNAILLSDWPNASSKLCGAPVAKIVRCTCSLNVQTQMHLVFRAGAQEMPLLSTLVQTLLYNL